jgi:hypothetical protein
VHEFSAGAIPYLWACLPFFDVGEEKVAKNGIALVRAMNESAIITFGGEQMPALRERTWLAIISSHMMVVVAPAAQARARPGTRA